MNVFTDVSQIILFIGIMAFCVSCITEALKKWSWFNKRVPTALNVILISLILCPTCLIGLLIYHEVMIEWYMIFASIVAAFIVALISLDGWERINEIWKRSVRR